MHFGQFNLMGYRTPGAKAHELYDNAVEQVKAAEANGFEIAWFAEHHFSNYCVCPSPLMMLARLAGETSRIKLGSAVVVTPLYHPVRLMSEIGMVDALTHGRLVLGVGSGYQPYEFERFGEELADSVPKLAEFMEMLELAFTRDTFSYSGKHYRLPETHIASRPVQGAAGDLGRRRQPGAAPAGRAQGLDGHADPAPRHGAAAARGAQPAGRHLRRPGPRCARASPSPRCATCASPTARPRPPSFIDNARHQIRLSQSLRHREELIDGTMLVEKPYKGEPPIEELARHMPVGDAETVAERLTELIRAARPRHMLLHFQAGASSQKTALQVDRAVRHARAADDREGARAAG